MALSSGSTPSKDQHVKKTDEQSGESAVREVSQNQTDHVAMVSRTATGEAHQHSGFEVIGLSDDASEAEKAAAENRPEKA